MQVTMQLTGKGRTQARHLIAECLKELSEDALQALLKKSGMPERAPSDMTLGRVLIAYAAMMRETRDQSWFREQLLAALREGCEE